LLAAWVFDMADRTICQPFLSLGRKYTQLQVAALDKKIKFGSTEDKAGEIPCSMGFSGYSRPMV